MIVVANMSFKSNVLTDKFENYYSLLFEPSASAIKALQDTPANLLNDIRFIGDLTSLVPSSCKGFVDVSVVYTENVDPSKRLNFLPVPHFINAIDLSPRIIIGPILDLAVQQVCSRHMKQVFLHAHALFVDGHFGSVLGEKLESSLEDITPFHFYSIRQSSHVVKMLSQMFSWIHSQLPR
jgi:hypothetical protein